MLLYPSSCEAQAHTKPCQLAEKIQYKVNMKPVHFYVPIIAIHFENIKTYMRQGLETRQRTTDTLV
jgi:hypothetical protein